VTGSGRKRAGWSTARAELDRRVEDREPAREVRFDRQLPLGGYFSRPGAAFNNSQIQGALTDKIGSELLFPIYDTLTGQGANAQYHIIAWAAFHITGTDAHGQTGTLTGWFTRIVWTGIVSTSAPPTQPDLGVRSVALVQ